MVVSWTERMVVARAARKLSWAERMAVMTAGWMAVSWVE